MPRAVSFFEFEIFDVRFGISVPKYIKMDGVAIALLKKMVITTRPSIVYLLIGLQQLAYLPSLNTYL